MCTQDNLNKVLSAVCRHAKETFGDKLDSVILYGSYARGDYDDESDIDIMVLVDLPHDDLNEPEKAMWHFASKLTLENDVLVSCFLQDRNYFNRYLDSRPFYRNVMREGIKVSA